MPELKFIRDPPPRVHALDLQGQPLDLALFRGRRIKRAKRVGPGILAMVQGPCKGARGTPIFFATVADYEQAIERVLQTQAVD